MANVYKFGQPIRLALLASDPVETESGILYYNTTSDTFRVSKDGAWTESTTGSVSLTGQTLTSAAVIIGNGSNLSASVDTGAQGDITAGATGLLIKSLAITNAHISATAAIAVTKLAALTASKALATNASGVIIATTVTDTELGYVSGVTSAIQTQLTNKLSLAGGTMSGNIAMGSNEITGLAAPTTANSAARKIDVENAISGLDFQKDVIDIVLASSTAPVTPTSGDRYILTTGTLDASWDTIPGLGTNDIVEYNGASWFVAYDVSVQGSGALVWSTTGVSFQRWDGSTWTEFGGLAGVTAGIGLVKTGNVLDVNLGAGIAQLPSDEVGIDLHAAGALMLTINNTADSTDTAAQLAIKLDGTTLAKTSSGLKVATSGIANNEIAAAAAIALTKLAALTANKATATDASGFIVATTVTDTELGYVSGVTSAIQTQLNAKATKALDNLASTAVNVALTPATANNIDLGTSALKWGRLYSTDIKLATGTGTPVITLDSTGLASTTALIISTTGNITNDTAKLILKNTANNSTNTVDQVINKVAVADSLAAFTTVNTLFAVAAYSSATVHYEAVEATTGKNRSGTFKLAYNAVNDDVAFVDTYAETAVIGDGLVFQAVLATGNIELQAKNTGANAVTLRLHKILQSTL